MSDRPMYEKMIVAFTDGACKGNPGPGGWGAVVATPEGKVKELGGGAKEVTNNKMEMRAVIEALRFIKDAPGEVAILTDSTYVIQGITKWIWGWLRNDWMTASGSPVTNKELWQEMYRLVGLRQKVSKISWHYVRGHIGTPGNERADDIASTYALGKKPHFYEGSLLKYDYALYDIPEDTSVPERSMKKAGSKKKAYSYCSVVDGKFETHKTWAECEARVKGRSGARFKKAMNKAEEDELRSKWS